MGNSNPHAGNNTLDTNGTAKETDDGLTIGQIANTSGVNVETVRYYQRIGLITEPPKPAQGYRRYPRATVQRIGFIKRAQQLGFSLDEIDDLLSLNDRDCKDARAIAEHKQDVIQHRVDDLRAMQAELAKLIDACKHNVSGQDRCAIIATLTRPRQS